MAPWDVRPGCRVRVVRATPDVDWNMRETRRPRKGRRLAPTWPPHDARPAVVAGLRERRDRMSSSTTDERGYLEWSVAAEPTGARPDRGSPGACRCGRGCARAATAHSRMRLPGASRTAESLAGPGSITLTGRAARATVIRPRTQRNFGPASAVDTSFRMNGET